MLILLNETFKGFKPETHQRRQDELQYNELDKSIISTLGPVNFKHLGSVSVFHPDTFGWQKPS